MRDLREIESKEFRNKERDWSIQGGEGEVHCCREGGKHFLIPSEEEAHRIPCEDKEEEGNQKSVSSAE